jgi:PHS family inorganic phosphate transporter-like MFS transporter
VGNILAPVLLFAVLLCLGTDKVTEEPWATEVGWRFLLGVGALPALLALYELLSASESHEYLTARAAGSRGRLQEVWDALQEDKYRRRLVGAAGGWLCFDVTFFGMAIFLPHVVHNVVDKDDEAYGYLLVTSAVAALINCIAIPAALLSLRLVGDDSLGRKNLQSLSFLCIFTAYVVLALAFDALRIMGATAAVIALFGLLFFALNFGAGMTTYMLPQESFPAEIRSSLNGFAAAAGKVGAIIGAICFAPSARMYGLAYTFGACAVFAVVGLILTLVFVPDMRKEDDGIKVAQVPEVQRRL